MRLFIRRIPYNLHRIKWIIHGFFTRNKCEYCGEQDYMGRCSGEVKIHCAMTAYHFEGVRNSKEDPNREFMACQEHWDQYRDHWEDMWSNVPRY